MPRIHQLVQVPPSFFLPNLPFTKGLWKTFRWSCRFYIQRIAGSNVVLCRWTPTLRLAALLQGIIMQISNWNIVYTFMSVSRLCSFIEVSGIGIGRYQRLYWVLLIKLMIIFFSFKTNDSSVFFWILSKHAWKISDLCLQVLRNQIRGRARLDKLVSQVSAQVTSLL